MNLVLKFLVLLPILMCMAAAYVVYRQKEKDLPQYLFVALTLAGAVYYSLISLQTFLGMRNAVWVLSECATMVVAPLIFPLTIMFLYSLYFQTRLSWRAGLLFLPVVVFSSIAGTLNVLLYPQVGTFLAIMELSQDNPELYLQPVYRLHVWVCEYMYPVLILGYTAGILWRGITILTNTGFSFDELKGFLSRGERIPMLHIFSAILLCMFSVLLVHVLVGEQYLWNTPLVASLFAVVEAAIIFVLALAGRKLDQQGGCTIQDLKWGSSSREAVSGEPASDENTVQLSSEDLRMMEMKQSLENLMLEKKIFLNVDLTIDSLAAELCSNRLYLSRLINAEYGSNFREYLNRYRVEYSQQYMLQNPDANQDVVATSCGFMSAQAFNKKFKEIVGVTPKAWSVMKGRESII